jgi:ribosomal protein S18 acetylase RimI-like enzyme
MAAKQFRVRKALPEDNERLAELGRETFLDTYAAENHPEDMAAYLDRSFGPEIQAAEVAAPTSCFLIAEDSTALVGYARLLEAPVPVCIKAEKTIHLTRLYARKSWIGCGVGAALMRACIDEAKGRQCHGIWLGVWGKNGRALRFYRKWGFRQVGEQPFLLGGDHQTDLIFWLPLDTTHDNTYPKKRGLQ